MSDTRRSDNLDSSIPLLEFREVCVEPGEGSPAGYHQVNLVLRGGDLILVRVPTLRDGLALADAAQGLEVPQSGQVLHRGADWCKLSARESERRRGDIGRVFGRSRWLSNLDVEENVMLRLRHRRSLSRKKLIAQTREVAAAFGMDRLPQHRPADVPPGPLQVAQWMRAFMGSPPLVLLEHPVTTDGLPVDLLVRAVDDLRGRGGAVLWLTAREDVWSDSSLAPRQRFAVEGASVLPQTEAA